MASVAMAEAMRGTAGQGLTSMPSSMLLRPIRSPERNNGRWTRPSLGGAGCRGANDAGDGTETDLGDVLAAVPPAERCMRSAALMTAVTVPKVAAATAAMRAGPGNSPPATAETERAAAAARAKAPPGCADAFVASIAAASPDGCRASAQPTAGA